MRDRFSARCRLLVRPRNPRRRNRCRLSGAVPTRFAPSDTFDLRPNGDTVPHFACRGISGRRIGEQRLQQVRDFLALEAPLFRFEDIALTAPVYRGRHDMSRPIPKALRRRFLVALGHAIHVTWPVLSAIIGIQLALGLVTGFVEGWSLGDAVYFTFITGLKIGRAHV